MAEENFNDRLDNVMEILDKDPELQGEQDTGTSATDPASASDTKPPVKQDAIGEGQEETNDEGKDEPQDKEPGAIEPPASWPTDEKEAFKELPQWTQELIVRREGEREAQFAERSRTIATRETQLNEEQQRVAQAQQQYAGELQRLSQLATQLMPAKFSDIQSEADYLRMKSEDPARASEYEAFVTVLRNSQAQAAQQMALQQKQHLDKELSTLQAKYPEFQDMEKCTAILNDVRKGCVDYYGFTQQEVEIIADHRHIPIIRDALAWRNHQAALKSAASKKVPQVPKAPAMRSDANGSKANIGMEAKSKILNSIGKESNMHKKAEAIANLIMQSS